MSPEHCVLTLSLRYLQMHCWFKNTHRFAFSSIYSVSAGNGSQEVTWRIPFVWSTRRRSISGWLKNDTQNQGISVCWFLTAVTLRLERVGRRFGMKYNHLISALWCTVEVVHQKLKPYLLTVAGLVLRSITFISRTAEIPSLASGRIIVNFNLSASCWACLLNS